MTVLSVADTHTAIWYLDSSPRLSTTAKAHIEQVISEGEVIGISSITIVELVYLTDRKRIPLSLYRELIKSLKNGTSTFKVIPLTTEIAERVRTIPRDIVPDMPDRIITATAAQLHVPLITVDEKIVRSGIRTIW